MLAVCSSFFCKTGWSRSDALHRIVCPPASALLVHSGCQSKLVLSAQQLRALPLVQHRPEPGCQRDGPDGELLWVPARLPRQYPAAIQLARELAAGSKSSGQCLWRAQWADGNVYEFEVQAAVVDRERRREADGREWDKPLTKAIMCDLEAAISVDLVQQYEM